MLHHETIDFQPGFQQLTEVKSSGTPTGSATAPELGHLWRKMFRSKHIVCNCLMLAPAKTFVSSSKRLPLRKRLCA
jgi:hypothetical protein